MVIVLSVIIYIINYIVVFLCLWCISPRYSYIEIVLKSVCSRAMASKTPVGFIGLGNMGNPMAKNLVKQGYPVIAYDVFPEACKEFQDSGAQV